MNFLKFKASWSKCTSIHLINCIRPYEQVYPSIVFKRISISSMYDSKYLDMPYHKLLEECEKAFDSLTVTSKQSSLVEQHTREQSKSRLWYSYRAGRITASKFKAAVSTDAAMPSQSLIKSICYPEQYKFTSAATK